MHIAVGCDHRGLHLKKVAIEAVEKIGHTFQDFGCYSSNQVDYPDIAQQVTRAVTGKGQCDFGILVCGTGLGMSIAANKVTGIRAALCNDLFTAKRAREHNNANVLCMGENVIGKEMGRAIVEEFLKTNYCGGRHETRVQKIGDLEREECHKVEQNPR